MREAYKRKSDCYKSLWLYYNTVSPDLPVFTVIYRMNYFKIIYFLSSVLLLLTIVSAQQYFFEEYGLEPNVRTRKDVEEHIIQQNNGELRKSLRFRRDDEIARHRRQGGHGNGGGGGGHEGITGPVHTFVKTDEHAHFKWGVRHHVGHEYAGHH